MKPYTLNELIERLNMMQERGCGQHIVMVSYDEECNGYHPLWDWACYEGEPYQYLNEETGKMEKAKTVLIG